MSEPTIRPKIIKILCQNGEMSKRAVQLMSESDTNKSLQIKDMLEKSLIRKGEVTYSYWDGQKKKQRTETKYTLYHINQNYKEYNHFLYPDTGTGRCRLQCQIRQWDPAEPPVAGISAK